MEAKNKSLVGKTAIVTGGASGIGAAIAHTFVQHGAAVWVLDREHESATQLAKTLPTDCGNCSFIQCDVSDFAATHAALGKVPESLDILINNAGISHIGSIADTNEQDLDRLYEVNVKGLYNVTHAALSKLQAGDGGSIVNMASVAATSGIAERFAYSMSKGAVLAMTRSIARDYVQDGIRCNAISPGRIHTPFVDNYLQKHYPGQEKEMFAKLAATQPIGRMGTPMEVAAMALYLCSPEAAFITGANFALDGGFNGLKI
tara:strand:- start:6788 stop:7567 length:780 start_codon:yes stop_codon:yes gene_type:complete